MTSSSRTLQALRSGHARRGVVFALMLSIACVLPLAFAQQDEGAGPDDDAVVTLPSPFSGNWRIVARDDRGDSALMHLSIQHGVGETEGSGDYLLLQPFCDAMAGEPITGMSECETTDSGDLFERVVLRRRWLVLVFHPTADGADHTLALRLKGDQLVGEYRNANVVLPIVAQRVP